MKPDTPRIDMPTTAKIGEVIQIKTKIRHPMETGWRKSNDGQTVPRNRLTQFSCSFEGETIINAQYDSGVASDPYLLFYAKVTKAGLFDFRWEGDNNQVIHSQVALNIHL